MLLIVIYELISLQLDLKKLTKNRNNPQIRTSNPKTTKFPHRPPIKTLPKPQNSIYKDRTNKIRSKVIKYNLRSATETNKIGEKII